MAWKRTTSPTLYKKSQVTLALLLVLLLLVVGFVFWVINNQLNKDTKVDTTVIQSNEPINTEKDTVQEEPKPKFDADVLQKVVDDWAGGINGTAGVVISDTNGNVLAEYNGSKEYFAASIYKLYVAYYGYKQLDAGQINPSEQYINGHTRAECLGLMIRESDSPCAEKLWAELGKQTLTDKLSELGISNTSMTAITTTAEDAATMLALISNGEGLSQASQAAYLKSMKEQIYRDTLNKGFSEEVIVYNKIGFNGLQEYHDTAIIELKDGRKLIVSVLTDGVGTKKIVSLGESIEAAIKQ